MCRALFSCLPVATRGLVLMSLTAGLTTGCRSSRASVAANAPGNDQVAIGYATTDRSDVTKPVSSLSENEVDRVQVNHVEELLQGRVAGLHVTRLASGEFSVRIRGTRSFSGGGEPLVVVDGIPSMSLTRGLANVAPSDVKRIDVLKGAAATMYGSRGANGVIMITTKRGR